MEESVPTYERFKLGLTQIEGSKWRLFERLATVFMAAEHPSLRPLASESGDGGMDAMLFAADDDPDVALQFSVRRDWAAKIRETCVRLKQTAPTTALLIFVSNQAIGPAGHEVKRSMRSEFGLFVDIRDREWMLTSRNRDAASTAEAEEFCISVADPYLSSNASIDRQAQALDDLEAKAAFVYLGLQWEDDTREKGLTKVCFEAMVRAILRETTSDVRLSREAIHAQMAHLLPAQDAESRRIQANGALARLTKVHLRHWKQMDEFCLTWEERKRLDNRLAEISLQDDALRAELHSMASQFNTEEGLNLSSAALNDTVIRARSVLERVLLDRGATFAEAVLQEKGASVRFEDIEAVVYSDMLKPGRKSSIDPQHVAALVTSLMVDPPDSVRSYLRNLADTYTLFAFMQETPDVQSAIVKIFAEGDIWLDTSVVLPLFGEVLLEPQSRAHSILFEATREAGLRLFVTAGVVQELATHISRSRGYAHAAARGDTYGSEPFLLSCYRLAGRPTDRFDSWTETFSGSSRPEDDVADYLSEFHGIELRGLEEETARADEVMRAMVSEIWHEARDEKDKRALSMGAPPTDMGTRNLLVAHDVENYVGTIVRRQDRKERTSAFGYKTWWLTLDGTAFRVARELDSRIEGRPPASPAISPDFMLRYLSIGPVRARLSKQTEQVLPLMLNMSILDAVPPELLELSDSLRKDLAGLPSHVIRRKIRDMLDEARLLIGARGKAGQSGLTDEIKTKLIQAARAR